MKVQHDYPEQGGNPAAFQEILCDWSVVASYNSIVTEARERLDRLAAERARLGALRTRLTAINELPIGWDSPGDRRGT